MIEAVLAELSKMNAKARKPKWCKRCSRTHSRSEPCKFVKMPRHYPTGTRIHYRST